MGKFKLSFLKASVLPIRTSLALSGYLSTLSTIYTPRRLPRHQNKTRLADALTSLPKHSPNQDNGRTIRVFDWLSTIWSNV